MKIDIKFSVTETAAAALKKIFPSGTLIRVSARPSGCSKTIYGLGSTGASSDEDIVEEISGIMFVADRNSLVRLDGVTLDWMSQEGQEGFLFSDAKPSMKCCSDKSSGSCCRKNECS
jgi:iron-sulfur cluster assembly accessory protein